MAQQDYYFDVGGAFPNAANGGDGNWDLVIWNWNIYVSGQGWNPHRMGWINGHNAIFQDCSSSFGGDEMGIVNLVGALRASKVQLHAMWQRNTTLDGSGTLEASEILMEGDYDGGGVSYDKTGRAEIKAKLVGSPRVKMLDKATLGDTGDGPAELQIGGTISNTATITVEGGDRLTVTLRKTNGARAASEIAIHSGNVWAEQHEQLGSLSMFGGNFFNRAGAVQSLDVLSGTGGTIHNFAGSVLNLKAGDFSGNISSNGAINMVGTGIQKLGGTNTLVGPLNLYSGVLEITSASAIGGAGIINFERGRLAVSGSFTSAKTMLITPGPFGLPGVIDIKSGIFTAQGVVAAGELYKRGPGQLILEGTGDNYSLVASVGEDEGKIAGPLILGKTSSTNVHAVAGIGDIAEGATVILSGTGGDQIYDGSGPGFGRVHLNGGTFEMSGKSEGFNQLTGSGTVSNGNTGTSILTLGTSNGSGVFSGQFHESNGARIAVVKIGSGTLTLNGANSNFSAGTTVAAGVLKTNAPGALGSGPLQVDAGATLAIRLASGEAFGSGPINLNAGARLDVQASSLNMGKLTGGGTVVNSMSADGQSTITFPASNGAFGGVIGGNPSTEPGMQSINVNITSVPGQYYSLQGANTYTGYTTIGGYVSLFHPQALGSTLGDTGIIDGGTLELKANSNNLVYAEALEFDGGRLILNTDSSLTQATWSGSINIFADRVATIGGVGGNAGRLTISGEIWGSGGLEKIGTLNTLSLTASNSYTGNTLVREGTLEIGSGGSLYSGGTTAGTIRVMAGAVCSFARNDTFGGHMAVPAANFVVDAGGIASNGAFYNTIRNLTLNGGELRILGGASANFPAFQIKGTVIVPPGGTAMAKITAANAALPQQAVQIGDNTSGGFTTFAVADTVAGTDLRVSAVLANGRAPGPGLALVASGLLKTGAGTMELTANNTYTGVTTISAGTLNISSSVMTGGIILGDSGSGTDATTLVLDNLATFSTPITVAASGGAAMIIATNPSGANGVFSHNGALTLNRPTTLRASFSNGARWTFGGALGGSVGTLTLDGGGRIVLDNSASNFTGNIVVTGLGTVFQAGLSNAEVVPDSANVQVDAGTYFRLTGPDGTLETINALTGTGRVERHPAVDGTQTLVLGSANGSGNFAGVLADANTGLGYRLNLRKTGSGTQTLSGVNTYTGTTAINGGTLVVNGSIAGAATVNSGGTLSGTGTVNGGVTVNTGGTVAQSSGTLTIKGAVINNGTIRLTGSAVLNATGATSFVNNGTLDLISGGAQLPANFTNGANGIVLTPGSINVSSTSKSGNTFSVKIASVTGHNYRLQRATDLAQPFADIGTAQPGATGTTLKFSDTSASGPRGFYRIAVE